MTTGEVLNREELAWAAGFFDGEGSTSLRCKNRGRARKADYIMPMLSISQHYSPECLLRFREAVGGFGTMNGPYRYANSPNADRWTWAARRHEEAQAVIVRLWPWLSSPKRKQAVAAFAAYNSDTQTRRRWNRHQPIRRIASRYVIRVKGPEPAKAKAVQIARQVCR